MPSPQRMRGGAAVVAVLVLGYSIVIAAQILLGVIVAGVVYGTAILVSVASPDGVVADMGRTRASVTGLVVVAVVGYAVVVAGQLLVGLLAALLVFVLSWLTAPDGPLVRLVRWVLAARDDLRAVREAMEADGAPSSDD